MANFIADMPLEAADRHAPHQCFSVKHLTDMEHFVRETQAYHQAQAEEMARYRLGIIEHLTYHHGLSAQKISEVLGGISRSRVEQILKGKRG